MDADRDVMVASADTDFFVVWRYQAEPSVIRTRIGDEAKGIVVIVARTLHRSRKH